MIYLQKVIDFLNKFKIPTLLGLGIIIVSIGVGVVGLVMGRQVYTTQASPDQNPQNIIISNITNSSVTISWHTSASVSGFIQYGQSSPDEHTVLDIRDETKPQNHTSHYIVIKNLIPQTTYQYKIFSGKLIYPEVLKFITSAPIVAQNKYSSIIGSVLNKDKPITDGVVYLAVTGANIQSSLIKNLGNFIIPISQMQREDLTGIYFPDDTTIAKLTVITEFGQTTALFNLKDSQIGLLKIGEEIDFTLKKPVTKSEQIIKFDLNSDQVINSSDYAIILKNFGKNPKEKRADLNSDGIVDQKDLDLMARQINK